jgi:hypothetical protein
MNLDEAQRKIVAEWIAKGLKLAEIQTRLASEMGVTATYMDVRFLVDDLKLTPKDEERAKPPAVSSAVSAPAPSAAPGATAPAGVGGGVTVSVDQLARPGALVSGKVTFSDGQIAGWHLDQAGRLGLAPQRTGYKPTAADLKEFQAALEMELARMGL